jgi:hypothetical protein
MSTEQRHRPLPPLRLGWRTASGPGIAEQDGNTRPTLQMQCVHYLHRGLGDGVGGRGTSYGTERCCELACLHDVVKDIQPTTNDCDTPRANLPSCFGNYFCNICNHA